MSILTLAIYMRLGPVLTWFWGPHGLLIAYILSNMTSTLYGVRQVSMKFGARPDVRASGRILLAASAAAIPRMALLLLHGTDTAIVNLIIGGALYLAAYLTLAPILGAVGRSDIDNLETILCKTRTVAVLVRPVLAYETRILSALRRD